jgi:hypothetical protein
LLSLAHSEDARAINPAYPDLTYWEQWALDNSYTISNYVYSEGSTTGQDGEIGNEFICIKDDVNQVIIGRPDVCGTYYNGLGYDFADITTDPTQLTSAPDIIDAVTGNLVDPNLQNWGGCNYTGQNLGGQHSYVPGGSMPNCGQDIINWSYGGHWVYRRHAIEQALKQAGVNVDGYTWKFTIKNLNGDRPDQSGTDTLLIQMNIWDKDGNRVHRKDWRYDWKFDWTEFSGTELFSNPLIGENLDSWQLQMYGRDSGNWWGYYGPEMMTPEINMIYSSNPCAVDPLLHPDCEGYVDAYANFLYDQQCTANPLYDSGCPNYQEAFYAQQCNANPLYDVGCPNYAQAYYDQQCSFNPLYDVGCVGYEQAYYDQQCSIDPLYDTGCSGYQQAYLDQQCSIDPLYDSTCDGYAQAYYDQQCGIDPLYDQGCVGYATAYYDLQCSIDPLYDQGCSGYTQAYYDQQCSINPLYDTGCPDYETAYFDQQCSIDPLYDQMCTGYADAYFAQQCSLNPLYDTQCSGYAEAYYDLQCSLDTLYDSGCNGYEEAYAAWQLDQVCSVNSQADPRCPNYAPPSTTQNSPTEVSSSSETTVPVTDPTQIAMPSTTGDATIDAILTETSDVTTTQVVSGGLDLPLPSVEAETTVQSSQEPEPAQEEQVEEELVAMEESVNEDANTETKSNDSESESTEESDGSNDESSSESDGEDADGGDSQDKDGSGSKDKKDKKESKREKLKKAITKKAMELAQNMSNAASLEAQQAVQAQVLSLINYVPDFNTYQRQINGGYLPDGVTYPDTQVPESRRGLRNGLAQQLLHEQMVDLQYNNNKE